MDVSDGGPSGTDSVFRANFDWSAMLPSTAVVESVTAASGLAETDINPLYDYVDPEALDAIMRPHAGTRNQTVTTVVFTFDEHEVTVYSDGDVVIRPAK